MALGTVALPAGRILLVSFFRLNAIENKALTWGTWAVMKNENDTRITLYDYILYQFISYNHTDPRMAELCRVRSPWLPWLAGCCTNDLDELR